MKVETIRGNVSPQAQPERLLAYLRDQGMARLSEIQAQGVTAATVSRAVTSGAVVRLGRGLYQLPDAPLDVHHSLAEAAKRAPKGVICLVSALAFHGLTDQMPRRVWIAIGRKAWAPRGAQPPLRIVRYAEDRLVSDVETHVIEGVTVKVFSAARTLAEIFDPRRGVPREVAVQALREALRQRSAPPSVIAEHAMRIGVWQAMAPYLEALTLDG